MERLLILEDGSVYRGTAFGSDNFQIGELVFNTSMTGYQEILTDNSYCGQIVMMTYPLIGNYGINRDDNESMVPCVFGFVVKDYCEFPSNFRCSETLDDFLKREIASEYTKLVLMERIKQSKIVMFLRSENSTNKNLEIRSPWIEMELSFAKEINKTILCVNLLGGDSSFEEISITLNDDKFHIHKESIEDIYSYLNMDNVNISV